MTSITDLLDPSAIALDLESADWRDAVTTAGRLLEDAGATTAAYTEDMLRNVDDNGPYIVVAPGFAFAHARPSEAVHRSAMSWVRLKEPVEFGHPKNDPVTLVVALAATDSRSHTKAMAELARLLGDRSTREALDQARDPSEIVALVAGSGDQPTDDEQRTQRSGNHKILTVCGNGLGTSLFLKNTLEQVLDRWGWSPFVTVEATDTISAKGKASEAVAILTSGEIARTLGDLGVPTRVVENFTSTAELDAALRDIYDLSDYPDKD